MEKESISLVGLTLLGGIALWGIFRTKTPGWGRYSTSTLILTLVLLVAANLTVLGKLEGSFLVNILFVIAGYAGGLIAEKKD